MASDGIIAIDYSQFFDRDAVLKALDREQRSRLSRAGAFVRRRARSSIRKRNRVSKPGSPPSSHTGDYRRSIFFGYDASRDAVVIGPSATFGGSEVPSTLEFGGTRQVKNQLIEVSGGPKRGAGGRFETNRQFIRYTGKITQQPRPHMRPALEKESPNFPDLFKNSVTR